MADERVKLDDDFETLQRLIDAEWRRWDDEYGPEEGVLAPRHYDLALKNIKDEIVRLREELEARDDAELIGHAHDARDAVEQRYGQGFFPGPTPMERQMADDEGAASNLAKPHLDLETKIVPNAEDGAARQYDDNPEWYGLSPYED